MFNEFLAVREGEERQQQRLKDAEKYRLYKELGYKDYKISRWVLLFIVLILVMAIVLN